MISQEVNQVRFGQYAAEVLTDTGELLLKEQSQIAQIYLYRTGYLTETLASNIAAVLSNEDGAAMIIKYPKYIRYLDLKKARSGRMKKVYHPIYNRPLYGYVYAYAFKRLRAWINEKSSIESSFKEARSEGDQLTINVSI